MVPNEELDLGIQTLRPENAAELLKVIDPIVDAEDAPMVCTQSLDNLKEHVPECTVEYEDGVARLQVCYCNDRRDIDVIWIR